MEKEKAMDEAFCSSCGEIIKKEAEICPKCGEVQGVTATPKTTGSGMDPIIKILLILVAIPLIGGAIIVAAVVIFAIYSSMVTSAGVALNESVGSSYSSPSYTQSLSDDSLTTTPEPTTTSEEPSKTSTPILGKAKIESISSYPYESGIGYPTVVGEVKNVGDKNAEYVQIVCTFYDSQELMIGTSFTYTDLDILRPEQKSPFACTLLQDTSFYSAKTQVQWSSTSEEPYDYYEFLSHSGAMSSIGYYQVFGEVKNIGDRQREYNQIVGTFYDSRGEIIATSFTYTTIDTLGPDSSSPFEMTVLDVGLSSKIKSYTVQAQS